MIDSSTFERPIYAGNAILTVKSSDAKKVVTVRGTSFEAAGTMVRLPSKTSPPRPDRSSRSLSRKRWLSPTVRNSPAPSASFPAAALSARPRSSRKSSSRWSMLLGAAVGASRAAVDAGYAPNDYQVGQTGKIVAPNSMLPSASPAPSSTLPA
ncbi:MAG: FAD-binding protein [Hyphomonas sp.]